MAHGGKKTIWGQTKAAKKLGAGKPKKSKKGWGYKSDDEDGISSVSDLRKRYKKKYGG